MTARNGDQAGQAAGDYSSEVDRGADEFDETHDIGGDGDPEEALGRLAVAGDQPRRAR